MPDCRCISRDSPVRSLFPCETVAAVGYREEYARIWRLSETKKGNRKVNGKTKRMGNL